MIHSLRPHIVLALLLCVLCIDICVADAASPAAPAAVIEPSLYSPEDNVQILNNDTLEEHLYNSSTCNFVQFINYFCGDCRRYAHTFKQIAWRLYDWRRLLTVSVVDCAQERNVQICRDYNIRQTPTLRLFPPHFQRNEQQIGFDVDPHEPAAIYTKLAEYMAQIKYTPELPNFEPITATDNQLTLQKSVDYCNTISYIVLVYQPVGTTIGRDLIFELLRWPIVAVRQLDDQLLFTNFGLEPSAKLALIDCGGNALALQPVADTTEAYVASVTKYLQTVGHMAEPQLVTTPAPNVTKFSLDGEQAAIISTVLHGQPKVYRADLEQAIDKLLHIELPKVQVFKGENMLALQQLLKVLRLFNPLNASGKQLINRLSDFVNSIDASGELSGVAFQMQVENHERKLPKVFKSKRYVGCIASGPFLRGFTCSLWTLFHYLTVESAKSTDLPPGAVLATIHGFAKHFFGCGDCVQHFMGMAERRKLFEVKNADEQILWLWEAHNEVNERIAGDSTEDPKFPKLQYPSQELCEKCHNPTWNRKEVLEFLKSVYDKKNLSSYGLPTPMGYD
ncbi:sulfhydryl oxidase 1 [Drosophila sulfurigaster albostrigata]|uniref:sulfhydryl oxidase 1 n=1 Tax=Drosophila sulfurigaster albostrigata TaxID=89887 RepID=UPI002D21CB5F|nr:sulfhydryl oxidase 1 [Drosophila sulfurigaster albostrigata]